MGIVIKIPGGKFRLHLKGASQILTMRCTCHVVVHKNVKHSGKDRDRRNRRTGQRQYFTDDHLLREPGPANDGPVQSRLRHLPPLGRGILQTTMYAFLLFTLLLM
jgi:hypothetical protein